MIPTYNKTQKSALLKALHTLAKDGPTDAHCGICFNLNEIVKQGRTYIDTYDFVAYNAVNWPGLTGSTEPDTDGVLRSVYPIANPHRRRKWEGEQLEQRMALIAYLTEQLEAA